jgi:hypothetical protein
MKTRNRSRTRIRKNRPPKHRDWSAPPPQQPAARSLLRKHPAARSLQRTHRRRQEQSSASQTALLRSMRISAVLVLVQPTMRMAPRSPRTVLIRRRRGPAIAAR